MNKVIMMGRLIRDAEVRQSQGEKPLAIAGFCIAVDRKFKKQGEAESDFFNCTAFGKIAEFAGNYLKKGTKVVVTGRLQNNNYTNKEGQKVYNVQIMVDEIEFAESKAAASNSNQGGYQPQTQPQQSPSNDGFMSIPTGMVDELPFA